MIFIVEVSSTPPASSLLSVDFRGPADTAEIQSTVRIAAGANITLSPSLEISGDSEIGSNAIVCGGKIKHSRIDGLVIGGVIGQCTMASSFTRRFSRREG